MRRDQGCMAKILQLTEVPSLEEDQEQSDLKDAMRTVALAGETRRIWAIEQGGPATRRPLPAWVSFPIEKAVVHWSEEHHKWDGLIQSRADKGLKLTQNQEKKYQEWKKNSGETMLLYNAVTQTHVTKLRSNADLKNVQKNFFSLRVQMNIDPNKMTVTAGHGKACQLVLVETEPCAADDSVPDFLKGGVDASVLEAVQKDEVHDDDGVLQDEDGGQLDEADALLQAEIDVDGALLEILADTEDELEDVVGPSLCVKRVKAFSNREAYKKIEALGLASIPSHRPGVHLSFHASTRTWQGFYPMVKSGLSFTFGGSTNRAWVDDFLVFVLYIYLVTLW